MVQRGGEVVSYFPAVGDVLDTASGTVVVDQDGAYIASIPPWEDLRILRKGNIATIVFTLKEDSHADH